MPPTLYLIDGHALAYRTFFALTAGGSTRLTTSERRAHRRGVWLCQRAAAPVSSRRNPNTWP